ncbi:MAG: hypothetical protein LBU85_08670 [Treponema sp.]|jgi:hypothetical protein|nr:hypothetical protein [Treponema sp.]
MNYNNQDQHYEVRLAGDLMRACENRTADFLNPAAFPYYTQDMFTKQVLRGAGQLQTLLNNAAQGCRYINYGPTYVFQDSKKNWPENLNRREVGCIIYKGKDENGSKHYEMISPANKLNPGGIKENPMEQAPVPNIGINRQTPALELDDPKGIEKYLTGVVANYFNAAFTKTPYYPPQWGSQETEMLSKALNADPSMALRMSQQAFSMANAVKMENTVNQELDNNVREAVKRGLPPFNTKEQDAVIGPVGVNGIPANGIEFANAFYNNSINGKSNTVNGNSGETAAMNGYIPYQTRYESPKNIDRFLVEQYGNLINASLTGMPYTGSISPAELKTLSDGIQKKMSDDPSYMPRIVNQAQQNVMGFHYMPYDKNDFIQKAQDRSSEEFKILSKIITEHVNDLCENKKEVKKTPEKTVKEPAVKEPDVKKSAAKEPAAKPAAEKPAAKKTSEKTEKETADKTAKITPDKTAKKPAQEQAAMPAAKPATKTAKEQVKKTTQKTAKSQAGTTTQEAAETTALEQAETMSLEAAETTVQEPDEKKAQTPAEKAAAEKQPEKKSFNRSFQELSRGLVEKINNMAVEYSEKRPSVSREVGEFVMKNIIEKKPALVLVDTLLGAVIDKAKKVVLSGKPIAAAFTIAANIVAPNVKLPAISNLTENTHANKTERSAGNDALKDAAGGISRAGEQALRQVKSAARR